MGKIISLGILCIMVTLLPGCKKAPAEQPAAASFDTLKVSCTTTYFNCSNNTSIAVYTNNGKLLSNIVNAGHGNTNLAKTDSVTYSVSMMDTAHNTVKPMNLLHSGDSLFVAFYFDTNKTQPTGSSGFMLNLIVKSNNIYLVNGTITQPNPLPSDRYAYTYQYVLP